MIQLADRSVKPVKSFYFSLTDLQLQWEL